MEDSLLHKIIDLAEVWALLIPITVAIFNKPFQKWKKPIIWYLIIALALNVCIDILDKPVLMKTKAFAASNHLFYNLNSVTRLLCFAWFFHLLHKDFRFLSRILPLIFLILAGINFIFFEDIFYFSSKLMAFELALLMVYCMTWYYLKNREEKPGTFFSDKSAWVVIGISFYASVNFFIFLFYKTLITGNFTDYALGLWDVHNIIFTIMCILFAVALKK